MRLLVAHSLRSRSRSAVPPVPAAQLQGRRQARAAQLIGVIAIDQGPRYHHPVNAQGGQ